jgi:hypothetical protein
MVQLQERTVHQVSASEDELLSAFKLKAELIEAR